MPNHVKSVVEVFGKYDELVAFKQKHILVENGSEFFDFNTVIKMPDDTFRGNLSAEDQRKNPNNWYDWSINNWGTKWNSYEYEMLGLKPDSFKFAFQTAWSMPKPVFDVLAEIYPNLKFEINYADEDIGHNAGTILIEGGSVNVEYINEEKFSNEVWGYETEEEGDMSEYLDVHSKFNGMNSDNMMSKPSDD